MPSASQSCALRVLPIPRLVDADQLLLVLLHFGEQRVSVGDHDVEDLRQHLHNFGESIRAVLQLPIGQVRALEQGADLEEKL